MAEEREGMNEDAIELPAATAWPFLLAFGVAIGFGGLLTHIVLSFAGIVLVGIAMVGWWFEVLPQPHVERVPVRPPAERARPVQPAPEKTVSLEIGKERHRVSIPEEIHPYSAGVKGGLVGGAAMAALAVLYGVLSHGSIWYAINLLAAAAMPSLAIAGTQQLAGFNLLALAVATLIHVVMSIFVGLLYGVILPMLPRSPVISGGLIAPLMWTGVVWVSLGVVNPALNQRIEWVWFIASQIAFGLAAGFVVSRSEPIRTMQAWPLAERAQVRMARGERKEDRQP